MKTLIMATLLSLVTLTAHAEGNFQSYMQQAGAAFKAQEPKQALEALTKAVPLASTDTEKAKVNNAIGWTYFSDGKNEKAKQHLQQALTLSTDSGNTRLAEKASNNLGVIEYTAGNLDAAEAYFLNQWSKESSTSTRYLKLIKQQRTLEKVNTLIAQGVTYALDKDYENAIAEYGKALAIEPENVRALEYKGYAYYRLGKYDEAITALKQAQTIKPDQLNVLINLMKAYCSAEKMDEVKQFVDDNNALLSANKAILQGDGELRRACGKTLFSTLVEPAVESAKEKPVKAQ